MPPTLSSLAPPPDPSLAWWTYATHDSSLPHPEDRGTPSTRPATPHCDGQEAPTGKGGGCVEVVWGWGEAAACGVWVCVLVFVPAPPTEIHKGGGCGCASGGLGGHRHVVSRVLQGGRAMPVHGRATGGMARGSVDGRRGEREGG
eukprot:scaffold20420_cov101-Isochrysis_galbana.AAC.1